MAHANPPNERSEGKRTELEDSRAKWDRPALYRLDVSNAESQLKKAMDGVCGKGS
jgi:hypothetical protein